MHNPTLRKNLDGNLISLEKYLNAMEFDDETDEFDPDEDDALAEDAWEARQEREREED